MKKLELEGKVAIVTGAGRMRGIGRASANTLARMGADVVITGTGRDPKTFPEDEKKLIGMIFILLPKKSKITEEHLYL